jgi:prohibitin 2
MFDYTTPDGLNIPKMVAHGIIALLVIIILFGTFVIVPAGYEGVETRFGGVVGVMGPGIHFKIPLIEGVVNMNTQTQIAQTDATAASSDLQQVTATTAVNFHVNPQDAATIYQNLGVNYQTTIIDPAIQESIKSVTANYTAEQLITQREQVRDDILTLLTSKMQPYGINVDALNIVNFAFSDSFNSAIEAKVTAQQNALTAQNQVAQATAQASSTIIAAEAQAKAIEIQAQAINSQGGADYVELQAINKWNGTLPTQMTPNATLPFLNLTQQSQ